MSTNRRTENLQSVGAINQTVVAGSFAPQDSTTITSSNIKGYVSSVNLSLSGTYTVTLPSTFPELLSGTITNQSLTAAGIALELGAYDPTAGTFVIRALRNTSITAGGVAFTGINIPADTNSRIHFNLVMRNSGVTR